MGGNQSAKPVVEAAKTVLSRRKLQEGAAAVAATEARSVMPTPPSSSASSSSVSSSSASVSSSSVPKAATPPVERAAPRVMEQNIDSSIMKEMSKWDVVKTIKHKEPKYTKNKEAEMASMVRHEEEQMTVDKRGTLTGRLSENHVLEIFVHLRDGTRTHQQLAAEYKLKEEAVKKLSTIARIPTVISDKNDKDMFVAK